MRHVAEQRAPEHLVVPGKCETEVAKPDWQVRNHLQNDDNKSGTHILSLARCSSSFLDVEQLVWNSILDHLLPGPTLNTPVENVVIVVAHEPDPKSRTPASARPFAR